jgi:cytochrome c6
MMTRLTIACAVLVMVTGAGRLAAQQPAETPAALYGRQCAACHGAAGVPSAAMARTMGIPDLTDAHGVLAKPDTALQTSVRAGKGKMQAYGTRLSADQIRQLVTYIRTLRH